MKYLFFALLVLSFFACGEDPIVNPSLTGIWELEAIYADPGDGSGDFQAVDSDLRVEFRDNGVFVANGQLCNLSGSTEGSTTGTYDTETQTLDGEGCNGSWRLPIYEISDGKLIISLACIEACQLRFGKRD